MSTFYGSLEGEKKTVTKIGQRRISGHIRSWDHGIRVEYTLDDNGNAICEVWETGGSNNSKNKRLLFSTSLDQVSKRKPGYDFIGGVGN